MMNSAGHCQENLKWMYLRCINYSEIENYHTEKQIEDELNKVDEKRNFWKVHQDRIVSLWIRDKNHLIFKVYEESNHNNGNKICKIDSLVLENEQHSRLLGQPMKFICEHQL